MSEKKKTAALDESALDAVTGGASGFGPFGKVPGENYPQKLDYLKDRANQLLNEKFTPGNDGENKP